MTGFVALWSHLLAAALYGALAVYQLRRWNGDARNRPLISRLRRDVGLDDLPRLARALHLPRPARRERPQPRLPRLHVRPAGRRRRAAAASARSRRVFAAVAGGDRPADRRRRRDAGIRSTRRWSSRPWPRPARSSASIIAAGALILVHNLYGQAAPGSRSALRFPMIALAAMWAYDLHLYTVAYFTRTPGAELFALRGIVLAALAPLFALGVATRAGRSRSRARRPSSRSRWSSSWSI